MAQAAVCGQKYEVLTFANNSRDEYQGDESILALTCKKSLVFAAKTTDDISEDEQSRTFFIFAFYTNLSQQEQFKDEVKEKFGPFTNG